MGVSSKLRIFVLLGLLSFSVGGPPFVLAKPSKIRFENISSTRFKKYISKFKTLQLPFIANTSCYSPDSSLSVPLNMDNDSSFIGFVGPASTIGMLPDTSKYYVVIYCTAAACYLPTLAVYSKNGKRLDSKPISKGCGADVGYACSEILEVKSTNEIVVTLTEENFKIDNLGNEILGTRKKVLKINRYTVNTKGKIKIDH